MPGPFVSCRGGWRKVYAVLLVILGAGASYDCNPAWPAQGHDFVIGSDDGPRMPLAASLFDSTFGDHVRDYPAVVPIMQTLRNADSVEGEIDRLRAEATAHPGRLRHLMGATYYLRAVIASVQGQIFGDGVTNHLLLVDEIEKWRSQRGVGVAYVTFNYDTLLEKALESDRSFAFSTMDDYVRDESPVFKLHGSINWWRRVLDSNGPPAVPLSHAADVLSREDEILVGEAEYVVDVLSREDGVAVPPVVPAVSLPAVTKSDQDFVCPASHLDQLRELLPTATHVLVIGWRGRESHFYDLWKGCYRSGEKNPSPKVMVVDSGDGIGDAAGALREGAYWLPNPFRFGDGFSAFVKGPQLKTFLGTDGN